MIKKKKITFDEVLHFLNATELKGEERIKLTSYITKNLKAFPISDVLITNSKGAVLANGKVLDLEELGRFKGNVGTIKSNPAFRLITEQILYNAISIGITTANTPEQVMFSRSAIWFITQFKEYIDKYEAKI